MFGAAGEGGWAGGAGGPCSHFGRLLGDGAPFLVLALRRCLAVSWTCAGPGGFRLSSTSIIVSCAVVFLAIVQRNVLKRDRNVYHVDHRPEPCLLRQGRWHRRRAHLREWAMTKTILK